METEFLVTLEKRVQELIDQLHGLKSENNRLETELSESSERCASLEDERGEVKERVSRILNALNQANATPSQPDVPEQNTEQETPY